MKILKWLIALLKGLKYQGNGSYYISGAEALPEPLDSEQERACLISLNCGEKTAKKQLIEHNLRLVVYIARKFDNTGVDLDDLISIGTIGLIKAINSYDVEKNIKLATFASRCIENEILMYLRRISRKRSEVSFDEPLNVDGDGNELLLGDVLGTEGDVVFKGIEKACEKKILSEALAKLPERELTIMSLRFGLNGKQALTQKEVATLLGISQSYISRLEKKIVKKLKKEIVARENA